MAQLSLDCRKLHYVRNDGCVIQYSIVRILS